MGFTGLGRVLLAFSHALVLVLPLPALSTRRVRLMVSAAYGAGYYAAVNAYGNANRLSCASNEKNFAAHIWDRRDAEGCGSIEDCALGPAAAFGARFA